MPTTLTVHRLSKYVFYIPVPTLTLPPADETNTYVIHDGSEAIVIDCGTERPEVIEQLADLLHDEGIRTVRAYVATHYHFDHTRGIPLLQQHFPAPIFVHPLDLENAAKEMRVPSSELLAINDAVTLSHITLHIQHRPGHTHGHIHCLVEPEHLLIVGDHMAGVGTVWIGPPDGHMEDYYSALRDIISINPILALPGHGKPLDHPAEKAADLLEHRLHREEQILGFLGHQSMTLDELVDALYGDRNLGDAIWVAKRTTQAHLARLIERGHVQQQCKAPSFRMQYMTIREDIHS